VRRRSGSGAFARKLIIDTNTARVPVFIGDRGRRPKVVAWDHKFGHVSAMARSSKAAFRTAASGRPASAGGIADDAAIEATVASEQAPLKLEKFLPYQLNVVTSLVSLALSRVYARRYGIGVPEWRVLVTLGQYGVMTGKAIGAHTHMHKTKVSRAVALMEQRKLLVRRANRADMRESFLSLTAAGRTMYEEVAPHALDFARRLTEILTPTDRDAFNRALKQLTERSAELVAESVQETDDIERDD
jgi:DNA-binding MarR family transcriptional regulator